MQKVFIDSDVLLDFFYDRKPFSNHASRLLQLCVDGHIQGFVSPLIIANVYYLLRKTANHSLVIKKLNQLLSLLEVVPMDKAVVLKALNSDFKDFEDALQNYAVEAHKNIPTLITRNVKDYKNSAIAIIQPDTFLNTKSWA